MKSNVKLVFDDVRNMAIMANSFLLMLQYYRFSDVQYHSRKNILYIDTTKKCAVFNWLYNHKNRYNYQIVLLDNTHSL